MNLRSAAIAAAKQVVKAQYPLCHDDIEDILKTRFDLRVRVEQIADAICEIAVLWRAEVTPAERVGNAVQRAALDGYELPINVRMALRDWQISKSPPVASLLPEPAGPGGPLGVPENPIELGDAPNVQLDHGDWA